MSSMMENHLVLLVIQLMNQLASNKPKNAHIVIKNVQQLPLIIIAALFSKHLMNKNNNVLIAYQLQSNSHVMNIICAHMMKLISPALLNINYNIV